MTNSLNPVARLTWSTLDGPQEKIFKAGDVVTIGRGDNNSIVINSPKISRNHASIEWSGERFVVRDLKSSNGTFVNGQRVESMPFVLRDGDELMLERLPFKFEATAIAWNAQDAFVMETVPVEKSGMGNPKASLEIISGPDLGKLFIISGESVSIGRISRKATWDVLLNDGTVSRPHATIEKRGSSYYLVDLGSANGTRVNELFVIEPVVLADGDEIALGETRLIFHVSTNRA